MITLKNFISKLIGVLILNGGLFIILPSIFYVVGLLYWQGLLNTLGMDYSFIRMDSYVFYIEGGIDTYNSINQYVLIIIALLYLVATTLFIFSDFIYRNKHKIKSQLADGRVKHQLSSATFFLLVFILCTLITITFKVVRGSYAQGIEVAKEIMCPNKEQLKKEENQPKTLKLKNGDIIIGKLVGCSPEHCIIYADNKAFTIEKSTISSVVKSFNKKDKDGSKYSQKPNQ